MSVRGRKEQRDDPPASGELALPLSASVSAGGAAAPSQKLRDLLSADHRSRDQPLPVPNQEFFLPVHGFVRLTNEEVAVLDHPALLRLGVINQLGQANLVYRGATHQRLEHALGTVGVAQRMLDEVASNHVRQAARRDGSDRRPCPLDDPPSPREIAFIRLGALLHDVGHLPAGHTLEDELQMLQRHDGLDRLRLVFDRTSWPGSDDTSLRQTVDREFARWCPPGVSASDIVLQIIAKDPPSAPESLYHALRLGVCRDMVGNTVCADLLDYLYRDWYHIGKPFTFEERILHYMEIRRDARGQPQFVISLGDRPKIRTDAVSAILNLLESRFDLAESVLFHRTKCAASAMLERALHELSSSYPHTAERQQWLTRLEEQLLDLSDDAAVDFLLEIARKRSCSPAIRLLSSLRNRRLYRGLYTRFWDQMARDVSGRLFELFTDTIEAPQRRNEAVLNIERDLGLTNGSLVMYCPHQAMNAKIAKVKIYINGTVAPLDEWERTNANALTAGHLDAQLTRFKHLWRVHFFLAEDEFERIGEKRCWLLREALKKLVLKIPSDTSMVEEARAFAAIAATVEGVPFFQKEPQSELVATRDLSNPTLSYPNGAPTLRTFFPAE